MQIHRRQFLKYCVGSAAALGLPMTVLGKLEEALAVEGVELPKVIWLNAANCSGCTVSLANLFSNSGPTDIADLLFNTIDLAFHSTLMGAAGDLAVQQLKDTAQGSYILAVEGGIPTAFNGHTCLLWTENGKDVTAMEAVQMLAPNATAILSIGTCASHGGIPAGNPNPTGIVSVGELTGLQTINIPGCPTHPDWIVWTIAHLLSGQMPSLDYQNRPSALYHTRIHEVCPREDYEEIRTFGVEHGCLEELGCKGPYAKSDCPSRKWNNGTNWCIGAGGICIACTESDFPDRFSPFYTLGYSYQEYQKPTDPEPEPTPASLLFTNAEWDAENSRIMAEGKGEAGQIVTISNADTGTQLGAVSVDSYGVWKFQQYNPSPIPARLQASSGGQTVFSDVANAPTDGETEPPTEPPAGDDNFELKRVEWRIGKKEFRVLGEGTPGTIVEIYNATTGILLGKKTTDSAGKWKLVLKNPSTVACTVRVVFNGQEVTRAVKNAPRNCV